MTAPTRTIDLNADLGENAGDDEALLAIVTSANVACGAHAGDHATMVRTCALAAERGVVIGAHPGYDDREHFGRRALDLPAIDLATSLSSQYAALMAAAAEAGATVRYVKPHGALYHRAAVDPAVAELVYREAVAVDPALRFLSPPGSVLLQHAARADHGVRCVSEGFADRAYELGPGGAPALVDRSA
ncbi:MAG: LamB/YcsF family protein, partial [Solirubrobacteraceae bacterium]|nr:LamB/YcsF family protein [Solirubrobacteraceae bacterium]